MATKIAGLVPAYVHLELNLLVGKKFVKYIFNCDLIVLKHFNYLPVSE
jgi:hypothetical protein